MIGRLRGILLEKKPPQVLIEVNGISYEVQVSMTTFYRLPELGREIILHTHLVVREDAHVLYGFTHENERTLFRNLIKVSNVGPKSALAILSGVEPDEFVRCVMEQDTAQLSRLPGIGKKTAERLVIEMRDRVADWHTNALEFANVSLPGAEIITNTVQDAISALIALGYKPMDARRVILRVERPGANSEELIRLALQGLAKGVQHAHPGSPD
ncbi:MAG: Holliday junction branch migration protein RuvA [Gammaproteobacteria bacterium]